jgi:hypothetical protein
VLRECIRVLVWNVPALEAIEALGFWSLSYRVFEIAPPGVGTRSPTLYVLHTYIGYKHFEPILPVKERRPGPVGLLQKETSQHQRVTALSWSCSIHLTPSANGWEAHWERMYELHDRRFNTVALYSLLP